MPSLTSTTTQIFASVGIDPSAIYSLFTGLIGTAVSFGLWLIQVSWPFLLAIGFITLMWSLAHRYASVLKH